MWEIAPYVVVQCVCGVAGTILAHLMFDLAPLAIGTTSRTGASQLLAEAVATFSWVGVVVGAGEAEIDAGQTRFERRNLRRGLLASA